PYEFHFQCINTHVLTPDMPGDNWMDAKRNLLIALKQGRAFIGYDLPAATRGFRFTCQGKDQTAFMGDEIRLGSSLTLQIRLPAPAECRLIRDGELVKAWRGREICTHTIMQPGAYRVECYINYLGKRRGWIFSNPIYVR
ncbi:MAG: hypothetical protein U1B80_05355, partial [Anaerolineaceae bacterium]|nr:hypothetical protein [Anaerolineaceae bacterium]